ncbi:unnamed protein product [Dicrocoelium dendriticum]|nr:unnamed protein product [Dicrocoelium dendriticum]
MSKRTTSYVSNNSLAFSINRLIDRTELRLRLYFLSLQIGCSYLFTALGLDRSFLTWCPLVAIALTFIFDLACMTGHVAPERPAVFRFGDQLVAMVVVSAFGSTCIVRHLLLVSYIVIPVTSQLRLPNKTCLVGYLMVGMAVLRDFESCRDSASAGECARTISSFLRLASR